jgi:hypothetical protein
MDRAGHCWEGLPTLFCSECPTVTFVKLPEGKIGLRSNSIDGEKVVPAWWRSRRATRPAGDWSFASPSSAADRAG